MPVHTLTQIEAEVNKTHAGLGALVCVGLLAHIAKKTVLTVAPAGTGKSAVGQILATLIPSVRFLDSVTRNGLQSMSSEMNGSTALWVIDDLGKIDTHYSRVATITTFSELVYSHFVEKHAQGVSLAISDFHGSAIINCQPGPFRRMVQTSEWEATIQDKTLRFYHLYRPLEPRRELPILPIESLKLADASKGLDTTSPSWVTAMRVGLVQWSRARAQEHMTDYLTAIASIDSRTTVTDDDYQVLFHLLRPAITERFLMTKTDLEGGRDFYSNLLCLLVEFATYGEFPIETIVDNYKVPPQTALNLMRSLPRYVKIEQNSSPVFRPTDETLRILRQAGVPEKEGKEDGRDTRKPRSRRGKDADARAGGKDGDT